MVILRGDCLKQTAPFAAKRWAEFLAMCGGLLNIVVSVNRRG